MSSKFLIIGNGRSGSTWLETSLDQLSEVICRREFKWPSPLYELNEFHLRVDFKTNSIIKELDVFYNEQPQEENISIVGSKLILDLYPLLTRAVFDHLSRAIDLGVSLVHIKRDYLELFLSWRARFGICHQISPGALENNTSIDPLIVSMFDTAVPDAAKSREVWLTNKGEPLLSGNRPEADSILHDVSAVVEDLLSFFYNDINILKISSFSAKNMVVDYGDIKQRFTEIARFIGVETNDAELLAPVEAPTTKKLPALSPELIRPNEKVQELSKLLNNTFWDVAGGLSNPFEVAALEDGTGNLVLRVPGLSTVIDELVSSNESSAFETSDPDVVVWNLLGDTNSGNAEPEAAD